MAFTDHLEVALLNHVFRASSYSAPGTLYVALHTAVPIDAGTGQEQTETAAGYARQGVAAGTSTWNISDSEVSNAAAIEFTADGGAWATTVAMSIFDALTTGNMLMFDAFDSSVTLTDGDTGRFAIDAITVTLE